jgi:uridine phosphorylase
MVLSKVFSGPRNRLVSPSITTLKVLGLKYAIGIGACGSFSEKLQIDDIVIADNAIISDGTSKEYSDDHVAGPSNKLLKRLNVPNRTWK